MTRRSLIARVVAGLAWGPWRGFEAPAAPPAVHAPREPYPKPRGVPGVTYFRVNEYSPPAGKRCYLDGVDVHESTFESDCGPAPHGWVKGYTKDRDRAGRMCVVVKYGHVEMR